VYVEEVQTGARPIEAVGTSTAAFIGVAPNPGAHQNEAFPITNWSQFLREYCKDAKRGTPLAQAVFGFQQNGGRRCYVLNVGASGSVAPHVEAGERRGVALLEEIDEVAIVAAPGLATPDAHEALISHCEKMKFRVAILDPSADVQRIEDLAMVAGGGAGAAAGGGGGGGGGGGLRPRSSAWGTFYFPWIVMNDPLSGERVSAPPSGHVAGVWGRIDAERGVHKAPANEAIRGALDLTYSVTPEEQEVLNPAGVNCIRFFSDSGIRVWGARTLADAASEWRYLNVRRLFNMVEESIGRGTRGVVFEPNDFTLWKSIRRDVGAFLTRIWRGGALFGRTPEEAFFVKCDEETNTPEEIDAGRVITVVGMAPVKPAEFVIFRIGQHAAGTQVE
jgi:phage tail sheath protein FI